MKKLLLIFAFVFPVYTMQAIPIEMGATLLLGSRMNYGADYVSINAPRGIVGLNNDVDGASLSPFSRPVGISTEAQLRAILSNFFYTAIGVEYTSGIKASGKYLLTNPISGALYQVTGQNVPVNGSVSLSHFSIPIQGGVVITYWRELRMYAGLGLSYNFTSQLITQTSANTDLVDFSAKSEIAPSFIAWHFNLMGEYLVIGSPEDDYRLTLNVLLQRTWGSSGSVNDAAIETNLPTGLPLAPRDVSEVNLSGYRMSLGLTYYFLRSN